MEWNGKEREEWEGLLRKRIQRLQAENKRSREAELAVLSECTELDNQYMLLEEIYLRSREERAKLAAEVKNLTKSHEEFKHTIFVKFDEKKKYLVDLVGQRVGADIISGISSAFDELKHLLDVNGPIGGDAAPSVDEMAKRRKEPSETNLSGDSDLCDSPLPPLLSSIPTPLPATPVPELKAVRKGAIICYTSTPIKSSKYPRAPK